MSRRRRDSLWRRALRKFSRDRIGQCALGVVVTYAVLAIGVACGWWATEWSDLLTDGKVEASSTYWFGTNWNGQDIFQRTLYSTKTAFEVGFVVAVTATTMGAVLGCISGFFAHTWLDELIIWFFGCLDSIPFYLFVAAVAFALKDNPFSMHIAMIATFWTATCRVIRGEVIKLRQLEFVEAARALGVSRWRIIFKHILPNTSHILLVESTIIFVTAIKSEVVLSFLGLGIKEGVSWGRMLAESTQEVISGTYNNFLAASGFLFVLVMAFNVFADSLQDALDPKKVS